DGRIARLTGTASAFGVEFDSLADIISFGMAPALLSFQWGLVPLGRLGWAAGFLFVAAAAMVLVPAVLMVSTIRFRSFKTFDSKTRRPYTVLIFVAAGIVAIATHPQLLLVLISYGYLGAALIELAITRFRHRPGQGARDAEQPPLAGEGDAASLKN